MQGRHFTSPCKSFLVDKPLRDTISSCAFLYSNFLLRVSLTDTTLMISEGRGAQWGPTTHIRQKAWIQPHGYVWQYLVSTSNDQASHWKFQVSTMLLIHFYLYVLSVIHNIKILTNIFLLKLSCNVPLHKSSFSGASISYQDELYKSTV